MAHNIDMTNGRANIAFTGSRSDVWHRLGQEMQAGMSVDDWAKAAGLDWHAVKARVYSGRELEPSIGTDFTECDGWRAIVRSDNQHCLGICSDRYQPVQPRDILDWFDRYIAVDDRFQLDVAGSLKHGEIIWATATYRDPVNVGGDKHVPRVLMTTTFDGTGSTINQGTMTRTVCNNTLNIALADKRAVIRTRHNTRFDPARVGAELAQIAEGFGAYKAMGDAMARVEMVKDETSKFFKACLDIPFEAKQEEISTRKLNMFQALNNAYRATVAEGTEANTAWTALNTITRYVDHDRTTRGNGVSAEEKQFTSAQFGSGAALKGKAVALLMAKMETELGARAPVLVGADTLASMESRLVD
jgi:phage/plasmid-like protein (TIGR03299 family)